MKNLSAVKVWNFDLPPYPREGIFHLDMSENCQVTRFLKFEAGRLARLNQLDVFSSIADLRRFQKSLRRKLWRKFGCTYDNSLPLEVKELGTIQEEGFRITKLIYQSRPGISVTALLYVPEGKGPFPAVIQMHGHNPEGKFGVNPQSMALGLVKSGYVCLNVDAFGAFERAHTSHRSENHGGFVGAALLNIGETLLGAQVVDNMRGVSLLESLPFVDRKRIGATGASGGGNQTMWLAAMDERIAAAMPVVSVGSFESYVYGMNCICELLPDGLTITEESGVLALIAPRYLRIGNALYDCNHDFSVSEMQKTYHPVEKVYRNTGFNDRISFYVADRVHGFSDRQREAALGFFAMALKGEGNGNPLPEPDYSIKPREELYLWKNPDGRQNNGVCSIQEYCRSAGEKLRQEYLNKKEFSVRQCRAELKKMLRMPDIPAVTLHKYNAENGVQRFAVESGNHLIPFLLIPGRERNSYKIVTHPEGKALLSNDELEKFASDGSTLILPDLFGTGETAQGNNTIGLHHQFFRQLLWTGRTLAGEWTFVLLSLAKALKKDFKAGEIRIAGMLETGLAAICANVLGRDIDAVEAVNTPGSMFFDWQSINFNGGAFEKYLPGGIYSLTFNLPGFLQWGDVSLAAALGHGKVEFTSPRTADGTPFTDDEILNLNQEREIISNRIKE